MGLEQSKLQLRQAIIKGLDDASSPDFSHAYVWQCPDSIDDFYNLFSVEELRHIRSSRPHQLRNMTAQTAAHLSDNYRKANLDNEFANCIRFMTRILPILLEDGMELFLENGIELIRIGGLLLASESIRAPPMSTANTATAIATSALSLLGAWSGGTAGRAVRKEPLEVEIQRWLLVMVSKTLYKSPELPSDPSSCDLDPWMDYFISGLDQKTYSAVTYRLLRIVVDFQSSKTNIVPYQHVIFRENDKNQSLAPSMAIHLLLACLTQDKGQKGMSENGFQRVVRSLERPDECRWLANGCMEVLIKLVKANTSVLPWSTSPAALVEEYLILLWQIYSLSEKFQSVIGDIETLLLELVDFLMYYIVHYHNDPLKINGCRLCCYFLEQLTWSSAVCEALNKNVIGSGGDESASLKALVSELPPFTGGYMDLLILVAHHVVENPSAQPKSLQVYVQVSILTAVRNLSMTAERVRGVSARRLLHLFTRCSETKYVLQSKLHPCLLTLITSSIHNILTGNIKGNSPLLYLLYCFRERVTKVAYMTFEEIVVEEMAGSNAIQTGGERYRGKGKKKLDEVKELREDQEKQLKARLPAWFTAEWFEGWKSRLQAMPVALIVEVIHEEQAHDKAVQGEGTGAANLASSSRKGSTSFTLQSHRGSISSVHGAPILPVGSGSTALPNQASSMLDPRSFPGQGAPAESSTSMSFTTGSAVDQNGPMTLPQVNRLISKTHAALEDIVKSTQRQNLPEASFRVDAAHIRQWLRTFFWGLAFSRHSRANMMVPLWSGTKIKLFKVQSSPPQPHRQRGEERQQASPGDQGETPAMH